MKIYGGIKFNKRFVMDGFYYIIVKKCKISVLGDYVLLNRKVINYIMKKCK